jgi:hypothetical protein
MDARLSEILTRLDQQDRASSDYRDEMKEIMQDMRDEFHSIRGKFDEIAKEKWYQRGFVAAITLAVSAAWAWFTSGHGK